MAYLFQFLAIFLQIYWMLIFVRVLMSWINIDPYSRIAEFIYNLTEPVLGTIRKVLPPAGMFDFSPLVALLLLSFIQRMITVLAANF